MLSNIHLSHLDIHGKMNPAYAAILSAEACRFLSALVSQFEDRRQLLLTARRERQKRFDEGEKPDFLIATKHQSGSIYSSLSLSAIFGG